MTIQKGDDPWKVAEDTVRKEAGRNFTDGSSDCEIDCDEDNLLDKQHIDRIAHQIVSTKDPSQLEPGTWKLAIAPLNLGGCGLPAPRAVVNKSGAGWSCTAGVGISDESHHSGSHTTRLQPAWMRETGENEPHACMSRVESPAEEGEGEVVSRGDPGDAALQGLRAGPPLEDMQGEPGVEGADVLPMFMLALVEALMYGPLPLDTWTRKRGG